MTDLRKAAEMALEALGAMNPYPASKEDQRNNAIQALRQALAHPEQEPVAWVNVNNIQDLYPYIPDNISVKPLYTAPPKREWVGLTGADKQEAFDETQEASGGFWEFADYLDAKLKEKNT